MVGRQQEPWEPSGRHLIRFRQLIVCTIFVLLALQTTTVHFRQSRAALVLVVSAATETSTTTTTRTPPTTDDDEATDWQQRAAKPLKASSASQQDKAKMAANAESQVEKGSKSELPGGDRLGPKEPPNREGVVRHSDDPKARADSGGSRAELTTEPSAAMGGDSSRASNATATATTTTTTTAAPKPSLEERLRRKGAQASTRSPEKAAAAKPHFGKTAAANKKTAQGIRRLAKLGRRLGAKRNSSIVINGRKFDQVESVECVDDQFYRLLSKDLELIVPGRRVDDYGAYYDYEYAKAISAIVETPRGGGGATAQDEGRPMVRDVVGEVRRFWDDTRASYERRNKLDVLPSGGGGGGGGSSAAMVSVAAAALAREQRQLNKAGGHQNRQNQQRHQLLNYQYLLHRLEELKGILMAGEDSLVVLNNRMKKLNQAPSEDELQLGLCSCITSRGGRTALGLMNELFVDKDSEKTLKRLDVARRRAEEAALDAAEYCSYWYGDTLRSEAVQKESKIKRLVEGIAQEQRRRKAKGFVRLNQTTITETKITKVEGVRKVTTTERKVRIVSTLVQMTDLWLPKLATWIKKTLKLEVDVGSQVMIAPNLAKVMLKQPTRRANSRDKRSFSTPFDHASNYADLDQFSSSLFQLRRRRAAAAAAAAVAVSSFHDTTTTTKRPWWWEGPGAYVGPPLAFRRLANGTVVQVPIRPEDNHPRKVHSYNTGFNHKSSKPKVGASRMMELGANAERAKQQRPTTTRRPEPTKTPKKQSKVNETSFENRISKNSEQCAADGFQELLSVAYDQRALMYQSQAMAKNHSFILELNKTFRKSFAKFWKEKRDEWSRKMNSRNKANLTEMLGQANVGRSVDEEISNSFEAAGSSYDRGAKLGFTIGKFVGDKAAKQWPDPAELNTFTYDSLFLAGVAQGYSPADSAKLERHIVEESAKRVAFTEANRQAFAKTVQSSYQNGAFIVPVWGVLHAQRAVAKQAAKEGAKSGFEAASLAAREFAPKAQKFFLGHKHQRQLAAPYKRKGSEAAGRNDEAARNNATNAWAGLSEEIGQLELDGEISRNISLAAIECGQKSGFLMGALMGLVVTPEAFETYTRFRGSLEALDSEFNQFKLGALRGYELGETFAYLNYTNQMNMNLAQMKTSMGFEAQRKRERQEEKEAAAAESKNKQRSDVVGETSTSLFEKKSPNDDGSPNTNNVFQYMVLNYGSRLVANHSRKAMLKIRTVGIDEKVLRDMKIQAGDLIAQPEKLHLSSEAQEEEEEAEEDPLEMRKETVGYLTGEFSADNTKKKPIKFDIINLGPVLEMADQLQNGSSSSSKDGKHKQMDGLDTTPLTAALSKVGKMFMKFSVAREMQSNGNKSKRKSKRRKKDELAEFLNQASYDLGDGYLCGTFSRLASHLSNGTKTQVEDPDHPTVVEDDFSLETTILDELARRIEQTQPLDGSVDLVEDVMQMTTMAPKRVEEVGMAAQTTTTTTTKPLRRANKSRKAPKKLGKSRSSLEQMMLITTKPPKKQEEYHELDELEEEEDYLF